MGVKIRTTWKFSQQTKNASGKIGIESYLIGWFVVRLNWGRTERAAAMESGSGKASSIPSVIPRPPSLLQSMRVVSASSPSSFEFTSNMILYSWTWRSKPLITRSHTHPDLAIYNSSDTASISPAMLYDDTHHHAASMCSVHTTIVRGSCDRRCHQFSYFHGEDMSK